MSDNSEVMSVHDQAYILDKVSEILKEIEYYSEDNCPEIFNELYNSISINFSKLNEIVNENIEMTNVKNIMIEN